MDTTIDQKNQNQASPKKGRFILRNLSASQKNALLSGGSGLVGLMGGGGIFSLFGFKSVNDTNTEPPTPDTDTDTDTETTEIDTSPEMPVIVYTEAPFAESVHDEMLFNEAFASARKELGQGGFFEWRGNTYNTYYREEWEALTDDQQEAFMASVHNSTDYESIQDLAETEPPSPVEEPDIIDTTPDITGEAVSPVAEATPVATDADIVVEEVDTDSYQMDINQDGIIDAVAIDTDRDDYVEVIAVDTDLDGLPDTYMLDADDSNTIDSVIIDDMQDGLQGDELVMPLDQEEVIQMDQLKENQSFRPNTASQETEIPEDLPDIDNDMDVSDFA